MDTNYSEIMSRVRPGSFVPDIGNEGGAPKVTPLPDSAAGATAGIPSFKDTVKGFLGSVNTQMQTSDQNMKDLATGRTNDMNKVVTSVEEANLAMQFTMAVRTKLIEAYQEISRMQV